MSSSVPTRPPPNTEASQTHPMFTYLHSRLQCHISRLQAPQSQPRPRLPRGDRFVPPARRALARHLGSWRRGRFLLENPQHRASPCTTNPGRKVACFPAPQVRLRACLGPVPLSFIKFVTLEKNQPRTNPHHQCLHVAGGRRAPPRLTHDGMTSI